LAFNFYGKAKLSLAMTAVCEEIILQANIVYFHVH